MSVSAYLRVNLYRTTMFAGDMFVSVVDSTSTQFSKTFAGGTQGWNVGTVTYPIQVTVSYSGSDTGVFPIIGTTAQPGKPASIAFTLTESSPSSGAFEIDATSWSMAAELNIRVSPTQTQTLTYQDPDGNVIATDSVTYNKYASDYTTASSSMTIAECTLTYPNKGFIGWQKSGGATLYKPGATYNADTNGSAILSAQFKDIYHYDCYYNDGTVKKETVYGVVTVGSNDEYITLPAQYQIRDSGTARYIHTGWARSSSWPATYSCGETVLVTEDMSVYAVWTPFSKYQPPCFEEDERWNQPQMTLCSPGSVYSSTNGTVTKAIGVLNDVSDMEIVMNFNTSSELNFRYHKVEYDDAAVSTHMEEMWECMQAKRLIFVDTVGYFVITSVKDGRTENDFYKDITAMSCDIEMEKKKMPYIEDGTYKFYNSTGTPGLLNTIVGTVPGWTIGYVDSGVAALYRTFEDVDVSMNVHTFLLQNMQDAYDCLFDFDIMERKVNVFDKKQYLIDTDIHITLDDVVEEIDIEENTDNIYTAMSVYGGDNVTIAAVNPLGTTTIYNFKHYLNWMSDGLKSKVAQWMQEVSNAESGYYSNATNYYSYYAKSLNLAADIDKCDIVLDMYKRCRENIVAEISEYIRTTDPDYDPDMASVMAVISAHSQSSIGGTSGYNTQIAANIPLDTGETVSQYEITTNADPYDTISAIDSLITAVTTKKSSYTTQKASADTSAAYHASLMEATRNTLSMANYFTSDENTELSHYIEEGDYTDEYIIVTDSMTYAEQLAQMKELYDKAKDLLERVCVPTQQFTVDVDNFIFNERFSAFSDQLEVGTLVNVDLGDNDVAKLLLIAITINYEDKTLSLTFGNRYNRFDAQSLYENALGQISKSSNSINYIKGDMGTKAGRSELEEQIQVTRELAKNAALTATNQEVLIDDTGYTGRKVNTSGTGYDGKQVKLINKMLVFTDDGWQTAKVAIGEIIVPDGSGGYTTAYGFNGETILANTIKAVSIDTTGLKAEYIKVMDGNSVLFEADGITNHTVTAAGWNLTASAIEKSDSTHKVALQAPSSITDSTKAIVVSTISGSTETPKFYVQYDGKMVSTNADVTGKITSEEGKIGGWSITGTTLQRTFGTNNANYVKFYAPSGTPNNTTDKAIQVYNGEEKLYVTYGGKLYAKDVDIEGKITATSGSIGGCTITNNVLSVPFANITGTVTADAINLSTATITGTLTATNIDATNLSIAAGNVSGNLTAATINAGSINVNGQSIGSGQSASNRLSHIYTTDADVIGSLTIKDSGGAYATLGGTNVTHSATSKTVSWVAIIDVAAAYNAGTITSVATFG